MNKAPQAVPDNDAAWQALPRAECGTGLPLPVWGRALSQILPRTTAGLLQLDYLHRAASPLDPELRSKLRYEVATANRSLSGQAVALADLRRAGLSQVEIDAWRHDEMRSGFEERLLLSFARSFSLHSDVIEDRDLAGLISRHGVQSAVAIVLHLAFANLHDRIVAGLLLDQELDEPAPPIYVRFDLSGEANVPIPEWGALSSSKDREAVCSDSLDPADLPTEHFGGEQRVSQGESVLDDPQLEWDRLCSAPEASPLAIVSRLVSLGHQRRMAAEWSACIRLFVSEARFDAQFASVVRWVDAQSLGVFC